MELNILRIDVDRSHRVFSTNNLSLNQCSNNNQIRLYYEGEYDFIQMSFRKPDGWLSDKVSLTFDVDEEGYKYAYYDVAEEFTSFVMGGRNAILQANLYFNIRLNAIDYQTATTGNIRINVNYVDDALVNTNYSKAYMDNINANIGALQNDFNDFKTGDIQVGSAAMDSQNNIIHTHYETKNDAKQKYDALDGKKVDRVEIEGEFQKIDTLETSLASSNLRVDTIAATLDKNDKQTSLNTADIKTLKDTTVSDTEFNEAIEARKQAEIKLQSQIDSINQSSNFKDMVATTTELRAYDKSKLVDGDRILVLADNTIYRFNAEINGFDVVGKYGSATYTKAEIDSQLNVIKSTIGNKVTLSNGELKLSKGNIPISTETVKVKTVNNESIWGEGNIVIPVDAEFSQTSTNPVQNKLVFNAINQKADRITVEDIASALNNKADKAEIQSKQDKLTAGSNITISDDGIISVSGLISLKLIPEGDSLDDYRPGLNNIIYIYKPDNETGYSEYLWVEEKQDFEPFGEAGIHLENYWTIDQVRAELAKKLDIETYNALSAKVSKNTADIATKADANTTNSNIAILTAAVDKLISTVDTKADQSVVDTMATKEEFDGLSLSKQDKLVSGQNIMTINGKSILGPGDLGVVDELTDLSIYYTKAEANPIFDQKVNTSDLNLLLETKADKSDLDIYRLASDSYTKEEVQGLIAEADISDRLTDYYIKSEVDELIQNVDISDELTNYYTKSEVDEAVAGVDVSEQLKGYYTKTESDQKYLTETVADGKYVLDADYKQLIIPSKTSDLTNDIGFITQREIETKKVSDFENDAGYLTAESNAFKNKQDKLEIGKNIKTIGGESILGIGNIPLITSDYVDDRITEANATTLASANTYTDDTIKKLTEDTEGALEAIKEIKEQIGSGESGVGGILTSINQNKTEISTLRTDVNSLSNTVSTNKSSIKRIDEDLITLNNAITAEADAREAEDEHIYSVIDTFTTQSDTKIANINSSVSSLSTRVTTAQTDISNHKAEADIRFSQLENSIGTKILFKNWTV